MFTFALFFSHIRMHNVFFTPVELPQKVHKLEVGHPIMVIGSCFSEYIGQRLSENGMRCITNPFGVLYNPISISQALRQVFEGREYSVGDRELVGYGGAWHSLMHHSQFSASTAEECVTLINQRLIPATSLSRTPDLVLLLTLGTSYIYRYGDTEGPVVGNCHKMPEACFTRYRLSVEDIVAEYKDLITNVIQVANPSVKIVFTVSPIRHRRDGMSANMLSKSVLLLAIDQLVSEMPECCSYFPSFEIMLDELRDYRFYAEDMLHPSPVAVEYIWQRFMDSFFSENARNCVKEWQHICKARHHKPFNPESEAYKRFLCQIELRIKQHKAKYPNFEAE